MLALLFLAMHSAEKAAPVAEVTGTAAISGKRAAGNIVVTLEGGSRLATPGRAVIDQRDKMFSPHVTVVSQGTTVEFPNNDAVFHNVFAYYNAKKFDLGMYPRGKTMRVTFDKTGVVSILCNVHSEMSAYVYVTSSPYHAVTDGKGRFTLKNVEPGTYRLHLWHESGAVTEIPVNVKPGNNSVGSVSLKK